MVVLGAAATALPAQVGAAGMLVSGTTQPVVGLSFDESGRAASSGTMDGEVTREMRGDTLIVTVIPH